MSQSSVLLSNRTASSSLVPEVGSIAQQIMVERGLMPVMVCQILPLLMFGRWSQTALDMFLQLHQAAPGAGYIAQQTMAITGQPSTLALQPLMFELLR